MAAKSNIEWTNATWNPVTGCSKMSAGCRNCYAERMAIRLQAMGNPHYVKGFAVALHRDVLPRPLSWRKPRMVFVNSMSDLFHEDVPVDFIHDAFEIMRRASWHTFQVLTKRSKRLRQLNAEIHWPNNVWMGVSVEMEEYLFRIDDLRATEAKTKFLSLEPLLGPIENLELDEIDWVIAGGESGSGARPMRKEWVLQIRDQCKSCRVPFFFKQWGGVQKKRAGRRLEGRLWNQMPETGQSAELAFA